MPERIVTFDDADMLTVTDDQQQRYEEPEAKVGLVGAEAMAAERLARGTLEG